MEKTQSEDNELIMLLW